MKQEGFVALISAIVISVLLLAITFSVGFSYFFARFNVLDSESKQRSLGLAEACLDQGTLDLITNTTVTSPVTVGSEQCTIVSAVLASNQNTVVATAVVNRAYTTVKMVSNATTAAIISWKECENTSTC